MDFKNKIVWITGASSGIGEALAYAFAKKGAKLVLSARRESELNRVADSCRLYGSMTHVMPFDVIDLLVHEAKVEEVIRTFGQIDFIVLNAGVSQRSLIENTKFDVYRQLFEVNFFSIVSLTQAILPIFKRQKLGRFVPIASVAGRISTPRRAAYSATKHALIGFFDSLRAEVYEDGVRVTTILPGYIKTNISIHALNEDGEKYGKMDPNQAKGLDVNETANAILNAINNGKNEFFIGGKLEALGLFLKRFSPAILFWMIQKIKNT